MSDNWKKRTIWGANRNTQSELDFYRDQFWRAITSLKEAGLAMNEPEDVVGGINNLRQIMVSHDDNARLEHFQLHWLLNNVIYSPTGVFHFPDGSTLPCRKGTLP